MGESKEILTQENDVTLKNTFLLCALTTLPMGLLASDSDSEDMDALLAAAIDLSLSQPQSSCTPPITPDLFGRWREEDSPFNPYNNALGGFGTTIPLVFPGDMDDDNPFPSFCGQSRFVDTFENEHGSNFHDAFLDGRSHACSSTDPGPAMRMSQKRNTHPTDDGPNHPKRTEFSPWGGHKRVQDDPWQAPCSSSQDSFCAQSSWSPFSRSNAPGNPSQTSRHTGPVITLEELQAYLSDLEITPQIQDCSPAEDDQGEGALK